MDASKLLLNEPITNRGDEKFMANVAMIKKSVLQVIQSESKELIISLRQYLDNEEAHLTQHWLSEKGYRQPVLAQLFKLLFVETKATQPFLDFVLKMLPLPMDTQKVVFDSCIQRDGNYNFLLRACSFFVEMTPNVLESKKLSVDAAAEFCRLFPHLLQFSGRAISFFKQVKEINQQMLDAFDISKLNSQAITMLINHLVSLHESENHDPFEIASQILREHRICLFHLESLCDGVKRPKYCKWIQQNMERFVPDAAQCEAWISKMLSKTSLEETTLVRMVDIVGPFFARSQSCRSTYERCLFKLWVCLECPPSLMQCIQMSTKDKFRQLGLMVSTDQCSLNQMCTAVRSFSLDNQWVHLFDVFVLKSVVLEMQDKFHKKLVESKEDEAEQVNFVAALTFLDSFIPTVVEDDCMICMTKCSNICIFPCSHFVCAADAKKLKEKRITACAKCKAPLRFDDFVEFNCSNKRKFMEFASEALLPIGKTKVKRECFQRKLVHDH